MAKTKYPPLDVELCAPEGEYFEVSLGVTISKDFNSVRMDVKYGARSSGYESLKQLETRVRNEVTEQLQELINENQGFVQ